jgi:hypothetical protein
MKNDKKYKANKENEIPTTTQKHRWVSFSKLVKKHNDILAYLSPKA